MKSFTSVLLAVTLASALPVENTADNAVVVREEEGGVLEARQIANRNDLEDGSADSCPEGILIYARGSTEVGNMGTTAGPVLAGALEQKVQNIWIQGVGDPYTAEIPPNFLPDGTNEQSIGEAKRLFEMAHTKCPDTPVVAAGYSQGTAVVGVAITQLDAEAQDQVVGTSLFGYTKNLQNDGKIVNYPEDRTDVYCKTTDAVCTGTLFILPAHFLYAGDAGGPAAEFLAGQIQGAGA